MHNQHRSPRLRAAQPLAVCALALALDVATAAAGWHLAVSNGALVLKHTQPFVMTIR